MTEQRSLVIVCVNGEQDTTTLALDEFVKKIETEIKNKVR